MFPRRRSVFAFGLVTLVYLLASASAVASTMTSASFILIGGSTDGGAQRMLSTALNPTIGSVVATIGQSSPVGYIYEDSVVGSGFWPIVAGPLIPDVDADGVIVFEDNCPFWANALQTPSIDDPLIGWDCLCGDTDDDGTVTASDVAEFRFFLVDPGGPLMPGQHKCTVIGNVSACDALDVTVLRRALGAGGLPPGIAQSCEAANPAP